MTTTSSWTPTTKLLICQFKSWPLHACAMFPPCPSASSFCPTPSCSSSSFCLVSVISSAFFFAISAKWSSYSSSHFQKSHPVPSHCRSRSRLASHSRSVPKNLKTQYQSPKHSHCDQHTCKKCVLGSHAYPFLPETPESCECCMLYKLLGEDLVSSVRGLEMRGGRLNQRVLHAFCDYGGEGCSNSRGTAATHTARDGCGEGAGTSKGGD